jgi:hypothetical protein
VLAGLGNVKVCGLTVRFEMMDVECRCADERIIAIVSSGFDDKNLQSGKLLGQSACDYTSSRTPYINLRNQTECTSDDNDVYFVWSFHHAQTTARGSHI